MIDAQLQRIFKQKVIIIDEHDKVLQHAHMTILGKMVKKKYKT